MIPLQQQIEEAEQRVIAHDAVVRRRAVDLEHVVRQRARQGLLRGALATAGVLLAATVVSRLVRRSPASPAGYAPPPRRGSGMPWGRIVAVAWPMLAGAYERQWHQARSRHDAR